MRYYALFKRSWSYISSTAEWGIESTSGYSIAKTGTYEECKEAMKNQHTNCYIVEYSSKKHFKDGKIGQIIYSND